MAPEKTDPDGETAANTSNVSEDAVAATEGDHDPYFEPVVTLPEIQIKTNEEEEEEMVKLRCKLFRYHTIESPAEWKERGTGDVKILKNGYKKTVRLLMRQDKTLKIRANHYITPYMELKPNCGSDRAWVWSVVADFADEEPKQELFAIRFANAENARLFKEVFDEARGIVTVAEVKTKEDEEKRRSDELKEEVDTKTTDPTDKSKAEDKTADDVSKQLEKMTVKGDQTKE
ncbi:ran-specific GTPase-activating protein isoform X2 [Procambarus clarkii]|uniref:ran-specific GTPase-activating protein isoform X2 n=1 Tax=Procambarus clarkii TaxID=6728 RepID=UPI001E677C18|nr:ran-specific GTPase-activating protein-like isoform X2 [Procambarus clarkii]